MFILTQYILFVLGKERKHPTYGFNIQPEDNFKMATVQLVNEIILICR